MNYQIPFANTDVTLLVHSGKPVWPVQTKAQHDALTAIAKVFGAELSEVEATCSVEVPGSSERVVALGPDVLEEARLYAHLTSRTLSIAETPNQIEAESAAIVVALRADITCELLERLYPSAPRGPSPGLIVAENVVDLRTEVLVRSAIVGVVSPLALRRVDIVPSSPTGRLQQGDSVFIGKAATRTQFEDAVSSGAGALRFVTHSDGIDAPLPAELVLCPMDKVPKSWDRERAPICQLTGHCHRRKKPIELAIAENSLVSPDIISARAVVLSVCWGLAPPADLNSSIWSLSQRLQTSSRVGVIFATWAIVTTGPQHTEQLVQELADGESVGVALARHNAFRIAGAERTPMCLLGDP
ncbi:MAG TPA: hypothetical protein VHS96_15275, partial [Bacteroidia bacterium]|nr:hypothetical protein [Bacteroidia bacterium]